jgi:hypothetical protein
MRIVTMTTAGMLLLAFPVLSSAAGRGIVSQFSGSYVQNSTAGTCPASGCTGDLVTCAPDEVISIAKFTVTFVEDICDDHNPAATSCDGKFTGITEECFRTSAPGVIVNGAITHFNSRGKTRDCFDLAGGGDCTGSTPAGVVYLEGETRTQSRLAGGLLAQIGEILFKKPVSFTDPRDGKKKKFKDTTLIYQNTTQPNDGTNCGASCGFAGVSFSSN